MTESVEIIYNHITATPTLKQFVLSVFLTFFVVYRYNVQRRIRYAINFPRTEDLLTKWQRFKGKLLNCESCFGFWLCFLISTNIVTGAAAFLLFNYYEQDRSN